MELGSTGDADAIHWPVLVPASPPAPAEGEEALSYW
jgi:hypothetical protein